MGIALLWILFLYIFDFKAAESGGKCVVRLRAAVWHSGAFRRSVSLFVRPADRFYGNLPG